MIYKMGHMENYNRREGIIRWLEIYKKFRLVFSVNSPEILLSQQVTMSSPSPNPNP